MLNSRIARYIFTLFLLAFPASLLAQVYTLTTVAGKDRRGDGKQAREAGLRSPVNAVQDTAGNVYIVDRDDHTIRRVAPDGIISTVAGTGRSGFSGDGGPATAARLNDPTSVRLDTNGNLLIADYDNQRVRKVVLSTGIITTVAGNGQLSASGDGGPATQAGLDPYDLAVDTDGAIYVADALNHRIRKISPQGIINTIAGTGADGFAGDGGPATAAILDIPFGVAVDAQKNVYIADTINSRIRKITVATGVISTIAGTGSPLPSGDGGPALNANLFFPVSVAVEANGDVLLTGLEALRRISASTGIINRVAGGNSDFGFSGDGGSASAAAWGVLDSVSSAPNGDILIADSVNFRVRRIRSGNVDTVAGVGIVNNVAATNTLLNSPGAVGFRSDGTLLISDTQHNQIRGVTSGQIARVFGDGYPSSNTARLNSPYGVASDASGNLYIADTGNNRILRVSPNGASSVFAGGRGYGYNSSAGVPTAIALAAPLSVITDVDGTVYIADSDNCRVRRVSNSQLTTIAGAGRCTFFGDNAAAVNAGLLPFDLALDGKGGLLVADGLNSRIRRIDLAGGNITTIAGSGSTGHNGDGGPATQAGIGIPNSLAVDSAGRIFFTELGLGYVRMIDTNGTIRTIAGTGTTTSTAESGPALSVSFDATGIRIGPDGALYVSDFLNDRVRKLTPATASALTITQGQGATGGVGSVVALRAKVADGSGVGLAGVTVRFAVTSGTAQLSAPSAVTGVDGTAQVQVTLGATQGPVAIQVSSDGLPNVTANMTITAPVPQIDDAAIVGAGLSIPSVRALSHGGILSAFGRNFGVGATFRKVGPEDLVDGKVPTIFAGICVNVGGTRAPVFGASDTQVNFQAPAGLSGNVAVTIITGCGTPNERATNAITVPAQSAAPEFFYFVTSAGGQNPVAATDTVTNALVASATLFPGSGIQPAKPGTYVTVYATGFGETDPGVAPGEFFAAAAPVKGAVRVLLNGVVLPAENVLYAGATPSSPGLYQLNILLPNDTPAGDLSLVIEIGGVQSPAGAYLTVGTN